MVDILKTRINTLFRMDHNYSWPLAIFLFALLIQTTYVTKFAILFGILVLVFLNLKNKPITILQMSKISGLIFLHVLAALSYYWSVLRYETLLNVLNSLGMFVITYLIVQYSIKKDVMATFKFCAIVLLVYIAGYSVLFFGESMSSSGLKAFYTHKNSLAPNITICLFFLIYTARTKKTDYFFIFLGIVLLFLTESKTSINLFFLLVFLAYFFSKLKLGLSRLTPYSQGFIQLSLKFLTGLFFVLIIAMVVFRNEIVDYLLVTMPKEIFTGRGELWLTVLSRTRDHLLLGIGPGTFWGAGGAGRLSEIAQTPLYINEWIQRLKAADGGYIDMIGDLGFVGLALLFITFYQKIRLISLHSSRNIAKLAFVIAFFLIFHNVTETDVFRFLNAPWFLFMFFMIYLAMQTESISSQNYAASNKKVK